MADWTLLDRTEDGEETWVSWGEDGCRVVTGGDGVPDSEAYAVHLTHDALEGLGIAVDQKSCEKGKVATPEGKAHLRMHPYLERMAQYRVEKFRERWEGVWYAPTVVDALRFVNRELSELDDVLMRAGYADIRYRRNSLDPENLDQQMVLEIGQVFMMLATLASLLGIDLERALDVALEHQEYKLVEVKQDTP